MADAPRATIDLAGTWEFATDPDDAGIEAGWYRAGTTWPGSDDVEVPGAWQERDGLREYTGVAWYRRTVSTEELGDERTVEGVGNDQGALLRFDAVDHEATVWVNGERVGRHRGGYLPFALDVTDALVPGENGVAVRVVDPANLDELPHGKQGEPWYTRVSGLWQGVRLDRVPATYVDRIEVTPDLDADAATVAVGVESVAGASRPDDLRASVSVERDGEPVARGTCGIVDGTGSVALPIEDPDYWTPEAPALYDVAVELDAGGEPVDAATDYFGMRSVSADADRLYLNGEPLAIRGALDQAYYPDAGYRPADGATYEREIRTAKALGFNLLRKHIKPAHPRFLELADRLGILVWEEAANPSVDTDASRAAVRDQVRGMIDRDYNRPSVIVWGLYNEEWGLGADDAEESLWTDREKQAYLTDLYDEVSARDPTRLVCDNSGWAHAATDLNDYHEYYVSPDRAGAWRDRLAAIADDPAANYGVDGPDEAPIVVSEFGTWGLSRVSRLREGYGGDPPWFRHPFLSGLKRPAGVDDRFEAGAYPHDDLDALADAWQEREFRSIKYQIETMRSHEAVAGYVITEFTDIEWEFNGILDYLRGEKAFHGDFAAINGPVGLRLDVDRHVLWDDGTLVADVVVANDTAEPVDATAEWRAFGRTGTVDVAADAGTVERIEGAIEAGAPGVDGIETAPVEIELPDGPRTDEPITVVPRDGADAPTDAAVYADDPDAADRLADRGFGVADAPGAADVAVVSDPDERAYDLAESGGTALLVPGPSGAMSETPAFAYRELPADASWNLCASFLYDVPGLVGEPGSAPGWAFEDVYPHAVVDDPDPDDVLVGYAEGWLANPGAAVVARDYGAGTIGACTVRVTGRYGEHPVGTALWDAVIARLLS